MRGEPDLEYIMRVLFTVLAGARRRHLGYRFCTSEQGQDLTEYSLLLAFVVLAAVGIFLVSVGSVAVVWQATNHIVNQAASDLTPHKFLVSRFKAKLAPRKGNTQ